jgi:phosphoribosylaminoimidazole (AIR) synthetase
MVAVVAQGRGTAAVAALEAAGERAWTAGRIAKSPSNETPHVELL